MSVQRSASISASQLLATIGTAANTLTTTFNALGHAADVFSTNTSAWAERNREKVAIERIVQSEVIRDEAAIGLATRIVERERTLSTNPTLKLAYDAAIAKFSQHLDPPAPNTAPVTA